MPGASFRISALTSKAIRCAMPRTSSRGAAIVRHPHLAIRLPRRRCARPPGSRSLRRRPTPRRCSRISARRRFRSSAGVDLELHRARVRRHADGAQPRQLAGHRFGDERGVVARCRRRSCSPRTAAPRRSAAGPAADGDRGRRATSPLRATAHEQARRRAESPPAIVAVPECRRSVPMPAAPGVRRLARVRTARSSRRAAG